MKVHTVSKGETVYSIAKNYSVSPADVINVNMLKNPNRLSVGHALMIPEDLHIYTASGRDTVYTVAKANGVTPNEIWRANPQLYGSRRILPSQKIMIPAVDGEKTLIETNAFAYPYTDERVARTTMPYLTYLSVLSYGITPDGRMIKPPGDETRIIRTANEYGTIPMLVVSSIGFDGMYSPALADAVIGNETSRKTFTDELIKTVNGQGYGGAVIDFEYFSRDLADAYTEMVSEITDALHSAGKKSFVSVPPKDSDAGGSEFYAYQDYAALGNIADRVIIMLNELVGRYDEPQPVTDVRKVNKTLDYAVSQIAPEKIEASFRSFGYDWALPFERGSSAASAVANSEAPMFAYQKKAEIKFESEAASPLFSYYDKTGVSPVEHNVYFDDARTSVALSDIIREKNIGGTSLWTAGRLSPQFWGILSSEFNIK